MARPSEVLTAIQSIAKAISLAGIAKSGTNADDGYSFRSIDDILETLSPMLADNNLSILPTVLERECQERRAISNGLPLFFVTVKVRYDLISSIDDSVRSIEVYGEAMDTSDKATSKAMTAAYKTAVTQAFCIATKSTPDADKVTTPVAALLPAEERQKHERAILAAPDAKNLKNAHMLATAAAARVGDADARKAFSAAKAKRTEELSTKTTPEKVAA